MVVYGLPSTVPVTLEMMMAHGGAVVRGAADRWSSSTCRSAAPGEPGAGVRQRRAAHGRDRRAGVKLEGGAAMAETIAFLVERGVPVIGHVGLSRSRCTLAATAPGAA